MEVKCSSSLEASKLDLQFPGSKMAILQNLQFSFLGSIEEGWRQKQRQRSSPLFGFVQYFAVLTDLPRSIWKKRLNSSYSSQSTEAKQLARHRNKKICPPDRRDDLCLCFCLHPSSMLGRKRNIKQKYLLKDILNIFLLARLTI